MEKKKFMSVITMTLVLSLMSFTVFADTDGVELEPIEVEEVVEELEETTVSYITFNDGSELTFVIENGIVVDVVETEEPAEETEEPVDGTEEPAEETEEPVEEIDLDEEAVDELIENFDNDYVGLSYLEAVSLYLETEELDKSDINIIANTEELKVIKTELHETFEGIFKMDTAALDSENPNAKKFVNAVRLNITNGKMNLLNKLSDATEDDFDLETWADMSVKDIMKAVKANKHASKEINDVDEDNDDAVDEDNDDAVDEDNDDAVDEDEDDDDEDEEEKSEKTVKVKSNNGNAKGKK